MIPKPDLILHNCDNCYYVKFKEIINRKPNNLINILEFINCNILSLFKIKGLNNENYIFIITYYINKYI